MQVYILRFLVGVILAGYPIAIAIEDLSDAVPEPHFTQQSEILHVAEAAELAEPAEPKTLGVWLTAYSSSEDETDETPFITAMNTEARDGIVATNILPLGTRILIPGRFGDKVFTVEDRMHRRKTNFIDVWMPTKEAAELFGIEYTEVVVLD